MDGGEELDGTGAFGPFFVLSEALPPGCKGLHLATRLNDRIVQHAAIADMAFDVESLIVSLSEAFTLSAGDIIVTGTPGGIGMSRRPPLSMKPGDVCEVEIWALAFCGTRLSTRYENARPRSLGHGAQCSHCRNARSHRRRRVGNRERGGAPAV